MSVLVAKNLEKSYQSRRVVTDVSLTIRSSEIVGILGPNGAGKTTIFYMIIGLAPCDRGTIHLNQSELTDLPVHARARMGLGYLPQEPSIFRKMTVAENVLAILETRPNLSRRCRQQRLETLLAELDISHLHDAPSLSLSGGERRRVEIVRALASEPRFILLDEPFAAVDPMSVKEVQRIIKHLSKRHIGVLITDHHVRETLNICDRAYIVNNGNIIAEGDTANILQNEQVRDVYLGHDFRL